LISQERLQPQQDREQFYAVSTKANSRTQVPPDSADRGHLKKGRQRHEQRREHSRSKADQHRKSHNEQECSNSTDIMQNLEPCKS